MATEPLGTGTVPREVSLKSIRRPEDGDGEAADGADAGGSIMEDHLSFKPKTNEMLSGRADRAHAAGEGMYSTERRSQSKHKTCL